jgi:ribosomal peptide maturation radical SAM protein 1
MDIVFCVLPFAAVQYPAIGVSLLHAQLKRLGISSTILYFNIDLAEWIEWELYEWIAQRTEQQVPGLSAPPVSLIGEWFFADMVFGDQVPGEDAYLTNFLTADPASDKFIPKLLQARRMRGNFVEHCLREIDHCSPRVVGFTTSFHQTCACLAVAQRLKQSVNPPLILFGGANCQGEMGLQMVRSFSWIDSVCTGEGDEVVPLFLNQVLRGGDQNRIPGMLERGDEVSIPPPFRHMDTLPFPEYSDYFAKFRASGIPNSVTPRLLIETARGCWWGEKQHCTFCGLNGATMAYRSKSPQRVLQELAYLSETYGVDRVDCVDNILDLKYVNTVFPELVRTGPKMQFFFETKSNLRFEQLRTLRDGGVRCLQPGIESFSNQILRLIRKGCTGLQNIQFLRWCEELSILPTWNILYGFPDEPISDYIGMAELIPLLVHLEPPMFCQRIRLDRFSPLFANPECHGAVRRHPVLAYSYVYPLAPEEVENLAYYFDFEYADGRDPAEYTDNLVCEVRRWTNRSRAERPHLDLFRSGQVSIIRDTRPCAVKPTHILNRVGSKLYLACDVARSVDSLCREFGAIVGESAIRAELQQLLAAKLMVELEGQYLSLAVMRNRLTEVTAAKHKAAGTLIGVVN